MGDLLIRGFEVPKDRPVIIRIGTDGKATQAMTYQQFETVALPEKHGRLIDADDLIDAFTAVVEFIDTAMNNPELINFDLDHRGWFEHGKPHVLESIRLIREFKTIIPASE